MKKGIVIGCVDPRLHNIFPKIAELMDVDAVYAHRIPGPDGILVKEEYQDERIGAVASVRRLASVADVQAYALVGHTNCAGHSASDDEHRADTIEAARRLKSEMQLEASIPVHAILAVRGETDADWTHEVLGVV